MARGCLIVLDAGEYAVRCRTCQWRSGGHRSLTSAIEAFDGHSSSPLHARGSWASSRDQAGAWDEHPCPKPRLANSPGGLMPRIAELPRQPLTENTGRLLAPAAGRLRAGGGS